MMGTASASSDNTMAPTDPDRLLLVSAPGSETAVRALSGYGFSDPRGAHENLLSIARASGTTEGGAKGLHRLLSLLQGSAHPDQALNLLERFARASHGRVRPFIDLEPKELKLLVDVFGASPFLADILIRRPAYLDSLADPFLAGRRPKRAYRRALAQATRGLRAEAERLDSLRVFKERELLRIGARDLGKLASVEETLRSLSTLAEVLIQRAFEICESSLRSRHRQAGHRPSTPGERAGFTVLGLGKLGGGELNFSSDVDLVYLYASDEEPAGLRRALNVPLPEFFRQLGQALTSALGDVTHEGSVYRVDLRLRPEGRLGSLVHSLKGARRYYASRGATWERLALLKAWPVAGDRALGLRFLKDVRGFVYARRFDEHALREVRDMKARIDARLRVEGQSHRNVKLGFGGIREVELVVQTLQVALGGRHPQLRQRNTLRALRALARSGILSRGQQLTLARSYLFLRDLENKLQMVHGFQTHSLPAQQADLRLCALRMGYRDGETAKAETRLLDDYRRATGDVNGIFLEMLDPLSRHFSDSSPRGARPDSRDRRSAWRRSS